MDEGQFELIGQTREGGPEDTDIRKQVRARVRARVRVRLVLGDDTDIRKQGQG